MAFVQRSHTSIMSLAFQQTGIASMATIQAMMVTATATMTTAATTAADTDPGTDSVLDEPILKV